MYDLLFYFLVFNQLSSHCKISFALLVPRSLFHSRYSVNIKRLSIFTHWFYFHRRTYRLKNSFKNGPFLVSFYSALSFNISQEYWLRTAGLWYQKRQLYQLSYNHYPNWRQVCNTNNDLQTETNKCHLWFYWTRANFLKVTNPTLR